MDHPQIEMRPVGELRPYPSNTRTHTKKQIKKIAASISRFGFTNPILISEDGEIIAGHGRVLAAQQLRIAEVSTLRLSHLSLEECRAYVLADNKLALNAGWDQELLAIELQGLIDLGFDVELTGFFSGGGLPLDACRSVQLEHSLDAASLHRPIMRNNDKLPARHRLKCLPIWKEGKDIPMPELHSRLE